jgi:hypothetical protein
VRWQCGEDLGHADAVDGRRGVLIQASPVSKLVFNHTRKYTQTRHLTNPTHLKRRLARGHLHQTHAQRPHVCLAPIPSLLLLLVLPGPAHHLRTHVDGGADSGRMLNFRPAWVKISKWHAKSICLCVCKGVAQKSPEAIAVQRHQSRTAEVREFDTLVVYQKIRWFYILIKCS